MVLGNSKTQSNQWAQLKSHHTCNMSKDESDSNTNFSCCHKLQCLIM